MARNQRYEPTADMREAAVHLYDWYQSMLAVGFSTREAIAIIAAVIVGNGRADS